MTISSIPLWNTSPNPDFVPCLDIYCLDDDKPRSAVLIFPGGGYEKRAEHEGSSVAEVWNSFGFHAFVCQYRVSPCRHPAPLQDAVKAMQIIRAHADDFRVIPAQIAVCGFSAGGHLAASLACLHDLPEAQNRDFDPPLSARPDAVILNYPVISSELGLIHEGSFRNLLGEGVPRETYDRFSMEKRVNGRTPPTFLWHTEEDSVVPAGNSRAFYQACVRHKVIAELHLYPLGAHGLGFNPAGMGVAQRAADFLFRLMFDSKASRI